jgi:HEPN domain-containing protein
LRFARDDLEVAGMLLTMHSRKIEIICYHCAQSAEKYLKAALFFDELPIPRIHNLLTLADIVGGRHPEVLEMGRSLADLQPYAVVVRYPLELSVAAGDEELAFNAASRIAERMEVLFGAPRGTRRS